MKTKIDKELLVHLPNEVKAMNLPPKAQEIYCKFLSMVDKDGWCYITFDSLAKELHCSKSTITANLKLLENRKLIIERVSSRFKIKLFDNENALDCNLSVEEVILLKFKELEGLINKYIESRKIGEKIDYGNLKEIKLKQYKKYINYKNIYNNIDNTRKYKFRDYKNYEIYPDGRIWSKSRNKWMKPRANKSGYLQVNLVDNNGKMKRYTVHKIVYEAVSGKPIPKGYEINHISENKTENFFENLQLVTHKQNMNFGTCSKRIAKANSKKVGAYKNGELVMVFQSTKEAKNKGFEPSAVSSCCRNCYSRDGNNFYKGFQWAYI